MSINPAIISFPSYPFPILQESVSLETMHQLEEEVTANDLYSFKRIFNGLTAKQKQIAFCAITSNKFSLITIAAFYGHEEILYFLLDNFEDKDLLRHELRKRLKDGVTPLYAASQKGHLNIINKILNCFETIEDKVSYLCQRIDLCEQNSLHIAVGNDQSEVVEYFVCLLEKCNRLYFELTQKDKLGNTPLLLAVLRGCNPIIDRLMAKLSNEERANYLRVPNPDGFNTLFGAIQIESVETINCLLSCCNEFLSKAEYIITKFTNDNTAIHIVAQKGNLKLLKTLLEHLEEDKDGLKQALFAKNRWGLTPLHIAIHNNSHECIQILLEKMEINKFDPGVCDLFNETPLHYAVEKKNQQVITWYEEHASHVFAQKSLYGHVPQELELIPIDQIRLDKKIISFLKCKKRLSDELLLNGRRDQLPAGFKWNPHKKRWHIPGLCNGLSFLKAYYTNDNKTDYFFQAIEKISTWDESTDSLAQLLEPNMGYLTLDDLIEQWLNDIMWFQHDKESAPFTEMCAQDHIQKRFEMVRPSANKKLKQEGFLKLKVNIQQLYELIELYRRSKCELLIHGEDESGVKHVVNVSTCKENKWMYYDSNFKYRITESVNDEHLAQLLIASFFSKRLEQMEINFCALVFDNAPESNLRDILHLPSVCGFTPLHKAQFALSPADTYELLKEPSNRQNQLLSVDQFQKTPLHIAVELGSVEKVNALLSGLNRDEQHECLMQKDHEGYTPLTHSIINQNIELTELLLKFGRKEDLILVRCNRQIPLHPYLAIHTAPIAIALYEIINRGMSHLELLSWLRQTDTSLSTIFHFAAYYGNLLLLERIMEDLTLDERQSHLNEQNNNSITPLDIAKAKEDQTLYEFLIKKLE